MTMSTLHDQHIIYVSNDSLAPLNHNVLPLLRENERMAFDLHSRTLILTTGDLATRVVRLSPIDAHLLLPLVYFYPHHVSNSTFAIGYTVDLFTYYTYLKGEMERRKPDGPYPIADGIDRLKKRVISLSLTVVRMRNTGYALERYADTFSKGGIEAQKDIRRYRRQK